MHGHHHPEPSPYILVCELDADQKHATATAFTGHQGGWNLTVEYLVDQGAGQTRFSSRFPRAGGARCEVEPERNQPACPAALVRAGMLLIRRKIR